MRIGLISDTHVPEAGPAIPDSVLKVFEGVDLILHAGDMHVIDVLNRLERIAPVLGARGNGDYPTSYNKNRPGVPEDPRVKEAHVFQLGGFSVGLTHVFPTPDERSWSHLDAIMGRIFGQRVDLVVCGDTHVEMAMQQEGVFLVNPGSPTLPHNLMPQPGTIAIMEVDGAELEGRIINLKDMTTHTAFQWVKPASR